MLAFLDFFLIWHVYFILEFHFYKRRHKVKKDNHTGEGSWWGKCHYHGHHKSLPRKRTCIIPSPEQAAPVPQTSSVFIPRALFLSMSLLAVLHWELKEGITHKGTFVIGRNPCLPKGIKISAEKNWLLENPKWPFPNLFLTMSALCKK